MMTEGPIENFTGGWAAFPFVGHRGHYWRDGGSEWVGLATDPQYAHMYKSLCGLAGQTTRQVPALGIGSFPRCLHCNKLAKLIR